MSGTKRRPERAAIRFPPFAKGQRWDFRLANREIRDPLVLLINSAVGVVVVEVVGVHNTPPPANTYLCNNYYYVWRAMFGDREDRVGPCGRPSCGAFALADCGSNGVPRSETCTGT